MVLYTFAGGSDGGLPQAGVIRDSGRNLYGTTSYGGAFGKGAVYQVDSVGNEKVLYSFTVSRLVVVGSHRPAGLRRNPQYVEKQKGRPMTNT
jgi:uncharacterized repeat protein (TIGR03803 family)